MSDGDMNDPRYRAAVLRKENLQHAMQTGVGHELGCELPELAAQVPALARFLKHERVGINTALCDHSALLRLLVQKGLITWVEIAEAQADEMQREVKRYEDQLSKLFGGVVVVLA